jgi:hypothetical protein
MMISYLCFSLIAPTSHPVPQDHTADLFDLIGFRLRAQRLQIQDFLSALSAKNVMTSTNPFIEAQMPQQPAQTVERNVSVRSSPQNLNQQLLVFTHPANLSQLSMQRAA